jgi:hypothetical protein
MAARIIPKLETTNKNLRSRPVRFHEKIPESENSHPNATRWPWQHSPKAPQEKQLNCEHRRRYITGVSPPARANRRSSLPSWNTSVTGNNVCGERWVETIAFFFDRMFATSPISSFRHSDCRCLSPVRMRQGREKQELSVEQTLG